MARTRYLFSYAAVALAAMVIVSGCQNGSSSDSRAAVSGAVEKLPPAESFALIVDTFRRGIEDIPIGFVMEEANGNTVLTGKSHVTHELFPPSKEDEPYRGVIKVSTQSRYSMERTTTPTDNGKAKQKSAGSNQFSPAGENQAGVEILDSDLVSAPSASQQSAAKKQAAAETPQRSVAQQSDAHEREYELVYQNDRWELVTKLDPQTEQAVQNAFDRALGTQT